jgi:hypothetical protein
MAGIDPKKMHALVDQQHHQNDQHDGDDNQQHEDTDHPDHLHPNADTEDEVSEEAQNQRKMDPQVGYMELGEDAGGFSCGNCVSAQPAESDGEATCINAMVRAKISTEHGCCNLWSPLSDIEVVFPPGLGGEESDDDEEDDEMDEEDDKHEADATDAADAADDDDDSEGGGFGEE